MGSGNHHIRYIKQLNNSVLEIETWLLKPTQIVCCWHVSLETVHLCWVLCYSYWKQARGAIGMGSLYLTTKAQLSIMVYANMEEKILRAFFRPPYYTTCTKITSPYSKKNYFRGISLSHSMQWIFLCESVSYWEMYLPTIEAEIW